MLARRRDAPERGDAACSTSSGATSSAAAPTIVSVGGHLVAQRPRRRAAAPAGPCARRDWPTKAIFSGSSRVRRVRLGQVARQVDAVGDHAVLAAVEAPAGPGRGLADGDAHPEPAHQPARAGERGQRVRTGRSSRCGRCRPAAPGTRSSCPSRSGRRPARAGARRRSRRRAARAAGSRPRRASARGWRRRRCRPADRAAELDEPFGLAARLRARAAMQDRGAPVGRGRTARRRARRGRGRAARWRAPRRAGSTPPGYVHEYGETRATRIAAHPRVSGPPRGMYRIAAQHHDRAEHQQHRPGVVGERSQDARGDAARERRRPGRRGRRPAPAIARGGGCPRPRRQRDAVANGISPRSSTWKARLVRRWKMSDQRPGAAGVEDRAGEVRVAAGEQVDRRERAERQHRDRAPPARSRAGSGRPAAASTVATAPPAPMVITPPTSAPRRPAPTAAPSTSIAPRRTPPRAAASARHGRASGRDPEQQQHRQRRPRARCRCP